MKKKRKTIITGTYYEIRKAQSKVKGNGKENAEL